MPGKGILAPNDYSEQSFNNILLFTFINNKIYTGFTRMIEHITNVHNIKDIYVTGLLLCAIDPLHMQILLRYK